MMSSPLPSNIHVFVTFKEDAIFAGESIEATITFRNVDIPRSYNTPSATRHEAIARHPLQASQVLSRPSLSRTVSVSSHQTTTYPPKPTRGHRPNLSLQIDKSSAQVTSQGSINGPQGIPRVTNARPASHGRSVSIVSLGNEAGEDKNWGTQLTRVPSRPGKHSRSSSLQVTPVLRPSGRASPMDTTRSHRRGSIASAPRYQSAESYFAPQTRNAGLGISANGFTSPIDREPPHTAKRLDAFQFPASPQAQFSNERPAAPQRTRSTPTSTPKKPLPFRPLSPRISEDRESAHRSRSPRPRNLLAAGVGEEDTPRSSTDVYSTSNGSDETLDSGFIPAASRRLLQRPEFVRTSSSLNPNARVRRPESLMMGYAHITGSFMLDGSLANQAPFEEVKRKAVLGSEAGGGVVGIEQRKPSGGFFASFGWSAIGESLGGLLHGGEMSSIREMKGIASSEDIPLLSTPKTILFVDLTLAPGESRSYSYSFTLPRGLPPSHKGRAMKVSYQLVIGTQRAQTSSTKKQPIRHAEVPFRVFGNVNRKGENLSHDLMLPHTLLQDRARTATLETSSDGILGPDRPVAGKPLTALEVQDAEDDFQSYVGSLLTRPRRSSSIGLLSPTDSELPPITPTTSNPHPSRTTVHRNIPQPSPRALIDLAIQRSTQPLPLAPSSATNSPNPQTTSPTHFTIARSGSPIATLILSRPFLRLGDMLHFALDFSAATIPCHGINITLESSESVAPPLALRSEASIERATRRVWDRCTGDRIGWAQQWSGSVKVPWTATPAFETTGIACSWILRIEITVEKSEESDKSPVRDHEESEAGDNGSNESARPEHRRWDRNQKLLRPVQVIRRRRRATSRKLDSDKQDADVVGESEKERAEDDRLFRSVNATQVESFEISVPLRVFGAVGAGVTMSPEEKAVGYPV